MYADIKRTYVAQGMHWLRRCKVVVMILQHAEHELVVLYFQCAQPAQVLL